MKQLKTRFAEKILWSVCLWHGLSKMVTGAWLFLVGSFSKQGIYTYVWIYPGIYASSFLEYKLLELRSITLLQDNNTKHLSQPNNLTWLTPCKQKNPFLLAVILPRFIRASAQTLEHTGNMQLWKTGNFLNKRNAKHSRYCIQRWEMLFDFFSVVKGISIYLQIHNSNLSINAKIVYINYIWIVQNQILCVLVHLHLQSSVFPGSLLRKPLSWKYIPPMFKLIIAK